MFPLKKRSPFLTLLDDVFRTVFALILLHRNVLWEQSIVICCCLLNRLCFALSPQWSALTLRLVDPPLPAIHRKSSHGTRVRHIKFGNLSLKLQAPDVLTRILLSQSHQRRWIQSAAETESEKSLLDIRPYFPW